MGIGEQMEKWTRGIAQDTAHIQDGQGKLARRIESLEMREARLMYRIDKLTERVEQLERLLERKEQDGH